MIEASIISFWDRIINNWENKNGLLWSLILGLLFYYFGILSIVNEAWKNKFPNLCFIILPSTLLILIFLFWLISTNRYFLRINNYISVGIIVICDEEKYKIILRKILRSVILILNDRHSNLKIRLLPTNICISESELNKYHTANNYQYDLLIHLNLDGGKFKSIEKIEIKSVGVTFRLNGPEKKVIINNVIDIHQDTNIQVASRDWSYILENSGMDKQKYIQNLNQIIIFYSGIYAIYSNKLDDALALLKTIYNPPKDGIVIKLGESNKQNLTLKPIALAQGRIGAILTELYFNSAIASYQDGNIATAIQKFEELTSLIQYHPLAFMQYISMARFSYELGNLNNAKYYTEKADKLIPNNINVFLNKAFFAILDNDLIALCNNYKEMYKLKNTFQLNWVDILEFQLNEKAKIKGRDDLFRFSTLMIEAAFIDNTKLVDFYNLVNSFKAQPHLSDLVDLGNYILEKEGMIKSTIKSKSITKVYQNIKKKQKKQNIRRKKR